MITAATSAGLDGVLAIGGGSVIDAAKCLRSSLASGISPAELLRKGTASEGRRVPLVVVPTVFGTGAEVSAGAILTDETDGRKGAVRGVALIPDAALISTAWIDGVPHRRVLETGVDAFFHACETYLSRAASPVTDILALDVLKRAPRALLAVAKGATYEGLELDLAMSSVLMGINLANSSTCLPHRMQYPVGALTDTSHQAGLAALYPSWFDRLERSGIPRLATVRSGLAQAQGRDPKDSSVTARRQIEELLELIGLRVRLSSLGISQSDLPRLASEVQGRIDLDPLGPDSSTILRIFQDAL